MKIAAIAMSRVPAYLANGIQVMKTCQAMAQLGHEVTLLLPDLEPGAPVSREWEALAAHYGLHTPFRLEWLKTHGRRLFTYRAVRRARALKPDLLYTWPLHSAVFGLLAKIPVVLELHEQPQGRLGPFLYRRFVQLPGQKRQVCITQALKDILARDFGSLPDTMVAPNGVDLERFAALPDPGEARRQIGLSDAPTVACTGHLYAGRGVEIFLNLAAAFPETQFLWAGGRPADVAYWQSRAAEMELTNVTFTGFIPNDELPRYQAAADVLLMPYEKTISGSSGGDSAAVASPMKMFDYMAAGRAILTSDLPVIREILDETSAVFCPPGNLPAWTETLRALLADPSRRDSLARAAQAKIRAYTWLARSRRILDGLG
jgi:glycosyltransferase involved in cell wall biosynthesis